jgi:hypothetical protein
MAAIGGYDTGFVAVRDLLAAASAMQTSRLLSSGLEMMRTVLAIRQSTIDFAIAATRGAFHSPVGAVSLTPARRRVIARR